MTATGKTHDFRMFKEEVRKRILESIKVKADSGFQGICDYHKNSETPKKKSKKNPLTKEDKVNNRRLSNERVLSEHINAKLKTFKIFSHKYRNRRKRYGLRANLICGIYNWELEY
jgi:hypothetical protein